ncbi:MAG: hypothetical protein Q4E13_03570 [Clostridia bacterium]|nr:hypothetical protein [Clostridia bacterium]
MNEYEKMCFLLEKAAGTPEEKAVGEDVNAILDAVKALTGAVSAYVVRDEKPVIDLDRAREALAELNRIGAEWEISFQEPKGRRDLALYLVQLAREILFSDRPS